MKALKWILIPPASAGYELRTRQKFLHITLGIAILALIVFGVMNYPPDFSDTSRAMFLSAGVLLVGLILNAAGLYYWAASLLTVVVILINFYNLYAGISLSDSGITAFPIILIFSSFLFGKRAIAPMTVINLSSILLLVYFERHDVIFPPDLSTNNSVIVLCVLLVGAAVLLWVIMENWERTLARARGSEKELRIVVEELSQARDMLEIRVQERTSELEQAVHELEAFSYSVSHDLRAPLRAIDGYSALIEDQYTEELPEEGLDYLHRIIENAQRMNQLIDDLLHLSQIGRQEVTYQQTDLTRLVTAIVDRFVSETGRNVSVEIRPCPTIMADRNLVEILLTNLLSNAWKFTQAVPNPQITFGSSLQDGKPVFFLNDNGIGFDMKFANQIFEPFQRLHDSSEFEGTGIGLAIVQRIITSHNGKIWFESEPGKGTTVFFTLNKPA